MNKIVYGVCVGEPPEFSVEHVFTCRDDAESWMVNCLGYTHVEEFEVDDERRRWASLAMTRCPTLDCAGLALCLPSQRPEICARCGEVLTFSIITAHFQEWAML